MSPRITDLVAGIAVAGAMLMLAWLIAVLPEDATPSTSLRGWARSRRGRRVIAAIMVALALAVLVLHILKSLAE